MKIKELNCLNVEGFMTLGDAFWEQLLGYDNNDEGRYADITRVIQIAESKFRIKLSFLEALNLWEYVSNTRHAGWLCLGGDDEVAELLEETFDEGLGENICKELK